MRPSLLASSDAEVSWGAGSHVMCVHLVTGDRYPPGYLFKNRYLCSWYLGISRSAPCRRRGRLAPSPHKSPPLSLKSGKHNLNDRETGSPSNITMVAESKLRPSQVTLGDAKRRRVQGTSFVAIIDSDEGASPQAQNAEQRRAYDIPLGVPLSAFGLANPRSDFAMGRRHEEMQTHPILRIANLSIRDYERNGVPLSFGGQDK